MTAQETCIKVQGLFRICAKRFGFKAADADDFVQEASLLLLERYFARFDAEKAGLSTFCVKIVANHARQRITQRRRLLSVRGRKRREQIAREREYDQRTPLLDMIDNEERTVVAPRAVSLLARLPRKQRDTFTRVYGLDGQEPQSPKRLALAGGLSRQGVHFRLNGGLSRLRELMRIAAP